MLVFCEMAEDNETTLQRSQSTPEPIFDPTSVKEVTIGENFEQKCKTKAKTYIGTKCNWRI